MYVIAQEGKPSLGMRKQSNKMNDLEANLVISGLWFSLKMRIWNQWLEVPSSISFDFDGCCNGTEVIHLALPFHKNKTHYHFKSQRVKLLVWILKHYITAKVKTPLFQKSEKVESSEDRTHHHWKPKWIFNLVENLNWQSMQKLAQIAAAFLHEYPGKCLVV